jgi:hypothetical protein
LANHCVEVSVTVSSLDESILANALTSTQQDNGSPE